MPGIEPGATGSGGKDNKPLFNYHENLADFFPAPVSPIFEFIFR